MKQQLEQSVKKYIERYRMFASQDMIVCAVSGGADSLCLLRLLLDYAGNEESLNAERQEADHGHNQKEPEQKERMQGLRIHAVHVHHGIRGASADRDAERVRQICDEWGVPVTVCYVDAPALAEKEHIGLEEAARKLRYEALFSEADQLSKQNHAKESLADAAKEKENLCVSVLSDMNPPKGTRVLIAVAHHRDDNAETLLMHLCRGAGLRGLSGIAPVKELTVRERLNTGNAQASTGLVSAKEPADSFRIIRPLLNTSRAEIEEYLRERNISWCTDETNADTTYTRNAVRQEVLPVLTARVNTKAGEHIAQAAEHLREVSAYLERQAQSAYRDCLTSDEALDLTRLREADPFIQTEVVKIAFANSQSSFEDAKRDEGFGLTAGCATLEHTHLDSLRKMMAVSNGTAVMNLPGAVTAERRYDKLFFYRKSEQKTASSRIGKMHAEGVEKQAKKTEESEVIITEGLRIRHFRQSDAQLTVAMFWQGRNTQTIDDADARQGCEYINPLTWELKDAFSASYTNRLDYDKMNEVLCAEKTELTFRKRAGKDRILIAGGKHKSLKKYMIDDKIPECARDALCVLAAGSRILWVPGFYTEPGLMATEESTQILELRYTRFESEIETVGSIR